MLIRNKDAQEGYTHVCNDSHKYTKQALKERLQIYLHDATAYTLVNNGDDTTMIFIKHCPYCGVEVEKDEYKQ